MAYLKSPHAYHVGKARHINKFIGINKSKNNGNQLAIEEANY